MHMLRKLLGKLRGPKPVPNRKDLLPSRRVFRKGLKPVDERVLNTLYTVRPGFVKTALKTWAGRRKAKAMVARMARLVEKEGINDETLHHLIGLERVETFQQALEAVEEYARLVRFNREHPRRKP